jgi:formate hydrogenlyase subunit 4
MNAAAAFLELVLRLGLWILVAPLLPGLINRVKAWVAGRRGPPVLQLYYDLARLWRKSVVMSSLASPGFIIGPAVAWVALAGAALLLPLGALQGRRAAPHLPSRACAVLHRMGGA